MRKRRLAVVIMLVLSMILPACGKSSSKNSYSSENTNIEQSAEAYDTESGVAVAEDSKEVGESAAGTTQVADPGRKLIKRQSYSVETKNFDKFLDELDELTTSSGGYVENSEVAGNHYNDKANRSANYTLRIPVDQLSDFKKNIEEKANVIRSSEQVEDVTLNYVDTESHITALKAEQESLMELMEKAETLEAIIAIQTQLTNVRYQLESYESQIRTYDNAIQYSSITISIREVEREVQAAESFGGRLKERLTSNLYSLQKGFYSFALWFLGDLPYILIAVVLILVVFLIIRKMRRNRKKNSMTDSGLPEYNHSAEPQQQAERKVEEEKTEN